MSNQLELAVEERTVFGKQVKRLRQQGIVPANMYGRHQQSVSLQVNSQALQKLLSSGGAKVILSLKVGNQPPVQALIKQVHHNPCRGEIIHVDFFRVKATDTLKTSVNLHFINEPSAGSLNGGSVLRTMNEVMVECLPADLPPGIQVDLSGLLDVGDVIRVGDLPVGPGVTILTDHNEIVAVVHRQVSVEDTDGDDGKASPEISESEIPEGEGE
jgi:large subunit ribosomal protein L25